MLIPCIDLQGGQAVQLVHGRKRELAVADVLGLLDRFGHYAWLHVIDLDAAMRKGHNNRAGAATLPAKPAANTKCKCAWAAAFAPCAGPKQLVHSASNKSSSAAPRFASSARMLPFLKRLAARIGKKHILIALDTAKGRIVIHGWRTSLSLAPAEVMAALEPYCGGFLCTDVDREGTMRGVNLSGSAICALPRNCPSSPPAEFPPSREIRALEKIGMDAAVGMALYKNRVLEPPLPG